jgi:hypothetical protein
MLAAVLGLVLGFGVVLVIPAFRSYFKEDGSGPGGAVG